MVSLKWLFLSPFLNPCCSSISSSCCSCRSSSSSSCCCPVVRLIVCRTFLGQEGVVNERLLIFFLFSFSDIGGSAPHQFIATAQYVRRFCWCAAFFIFFYFFVVVFVVAGFIDYSVFARLPFGGGGLHAQRSGNPGLECCSRSWWCCWNRCCCSSFCGTVGAAADATDDTSRAGAHKAIFVEHLLLLLPTVLQQPQLTFQLLFALHQSTAASLQYCSFTLRRLRLQLPFLLSSWFQFQFHCRCGRTWPWSCSRFWSWFCFWLLSSCFR